VDCGCHLFFTPKECLQSLSLQGIGLPLGSWQYSSRMGLGLLRFSRFVDLAMYSPLLRIRHVALVFGVWPVLPVSGQCKPWIFQKDFRPLGEFLGCLGVL